MDQETITNLSENFLRIWHLGSYQENILYIWEHIINPSETYRKLYPESCIFTIGSKVYYISQKWDSPIKLTWTWGERETEISVYSKSDKFYRALLSHIYS